MKPWLWLGFAAVLFALGGCAKPAPPYDYTAFTRSKPRSILVLPPLNSSPEVKAGHGVLAQVAFPLAESGYYVLPVSLRLAQGTHNLDTEGTMDQFLDEVHGLRCP